jgi:tetratricopeptide (TPR) repeat protein
MSGHESIDGTSDDCGDDGPTTEELWDLLIERSGLDRVEILIELSCRIEDSDIGTALTLADEAVVEARAELSDDHVIGALLNLGRLQYGQRRFVDSSTTYLEAASLSTQGTDAVRTGHSHLMAGDACAFADDVEGALAALATSEAAFLCEEEWLGAGYVTLRAGRALSLVRRSDEACAWLDRARGYFQRAGQPEQVLETDHMRAHVLRDLSRYDEAIAILTSCLAVSPTIRPQAHGSVEHFRLGRVYRSAGRFALAIEHLTRAHSHAAAHAQVHDVGQCLRELAMCHFFMEPAAADEALNLLVQARAHYDISGCAECVIECDEDRAEWLALLGRFDEAADVNGRLTREENGDVVRGAHLRRADNLLRLGLFDEALTELPEDNVQDRPDNAQDRPLGERVRSCQVRASALYGLRRHAEAAICADEGLLLVDETTEARVRASLLEVRSEVRGGADALNDRAQAIAYYLAAGDVVTAERLSRAFVSAPRPQRADADHGAFTVTSASDIPVDSSDITLESDSTTD